MPPVPKAHVSKHASNTYLHIVRGVVCLPFKLIHLPFCPLDNKAVILTSEEEIQRNTFPSPPRPGSPFLLRRQFNNKLVFTGI